MSAACAALLAAFMPGVDPAGLDRQKVYEIPAGVVEQMTRPERYLARRCAARAGIKWKVAD